MAVHSPPLQGSQDIGSINGSIICKDLKPPDYLIRGPKGTFDLTSVSRDVAATVCEHFLFLCLSLLQVPLKCLTSVLLFLLLAFLTVGGFMSCRDENFLSFGSALALGTPSMMPVQTSAAPWQLVMLPGRGLGSFVWVHRCRGWCSLRVCPHVVAGIHLLARHWWCTAPWSGRLLGRWCHCMVPWCNALCPHRV